MLANLAGWLPLPPDPALGPMPIPPQLTIWPGRLARSWREERALLAERVPGELLDQWGRKLLQAIRLGKGLSRGLDRRSVLLGVHYRQLHCLEVPEHVRRALCDHWGVVERGTSLLRAGSGTKGCLSDARLTQGYVVRSRAVGLSPILSSQRMQGACGCDNC